MNVKLRVLTAGVLFFTGQLAYAQDSSKTKKGQEEKIEEVVVLGYNKTATKPKDVSSSVTISAEKFENRPNASFLNSLQGEAPGLAINSTSGSPGSAKIDVIIRGVGSINSSSDPLYVIDGMISNSVQFRNLNPNDLEAVSVLKDAAATSIYGNRGANGVIVIRTKQGKFGSRLNVSYSGTIGVSVLPDTKYNMASARDLLTLQKRTNNGQGASMTDQQIADFATNTDWRKELFRTGMTQSQDLSMMFGGELVNNYTSFGYMDQEGVVPQTDFKRFTLRNNLNGKSKNNKFTYNANIALGYSKRHQLDEETSTGISSNVVQNPLLAGITGNPTLPANIYSSGQQAYDGMGGGNTAGGKNIYVLEDVLRGALPNLLTETSIVSNFSASYRLTDDLTVTNKSGVDYRYTERFFARSPGSFLSIAVAKQSATAAVPNPYGGSESILKQREFNFNSVTSLNYHKVLNDKHTFDVGAYMDYLKVDYATTGQTQNGLNPLNWVFGTGAGYVPFTVDQPTFYRPTISALKVNAGTLAYFATLDYDYDSKYGVSGVVRRDGTYRFASDFKWGTFWSVAGRWNIDKESFMEGSTFDMLKLRGSYGIQGNQNVVAATAGTNPLLVGTNLVRDLNTVGVGYNNINGSYYTGALANPNVQWEEIGQFDVGVDFRMLDRKLEGSFDFYNKRTNKLYNDLYISNVTGTTQISGNNGSLQNRGVEGMLRYNIISKPDVRLSIYANAAYNKSKILDLIKNDEVGSIRNVVGGQLAEWYAVPYVGVNQSNGNLLYLDINGNVTENPNPDKDARATGKNYLPKWMGGFGLNSEYKGFFLDAHFSFQQGAWRYDNQLDWVSDVSSANNFNVSSDLLNAWTPTNTNTNIPSLTANLGLAGSSDRYLKDASFVRLKTFSIGYNIPKSLLNEKLKGVKVFVQGENLLTFTKWKGYDPEPNFATSISVYPNLKTVSLGVSADF